MKTALILIFGLTASASLAMEGLRESDAEFAPAELVELLAGQVVEFFDGSKSTYQQDGRYNYTYTDDGPIWTGAYRMGEQSAVCVEFDNGSERCDVFVKDGTRVVLITADGLRFPIRNITVATE